MFCGQRKPTTGVSCYDALNSCSATGVMCMIWECVWSHITCTCTCIIIILYMCMHSMMMYILVGDCSCEIKARHKHVDKPPCAPPSYMYNALSVVG